MIEKIKGGFVVYSRGPVRPGVFDSRAAAVAGAKFPDAILRALHSKAHAAGRTTITAQDLKRAVVLKKFQTGATITLKGKS